MPLIWSFRLGLFTLHIRMSFCVDKVFFTNLYILFVLIYESCKKCQLFTKKFYFSLNNTKCRPVSHAFPVSAEMHADALVAAHACPTRVISRPPRRVWTVPRTQAGSSLALLSKADTKHNDQRGRIGSRFSRSHHKGTTHNPQSHNSVSNSNVAR